MVYSKAWLCSFSWWSAHFANQRFAKWSDQL